MAEGAKSKLGEAMPPSKTPMFDPTIIPRAGQYVDTVGAVIVTNW